MLRSDWPFLIVASSARLLARSAVRTGLPVVALDAFGDADTRACVDAWRGVGAAMGELDAARVLEAADELCPPGRCGGVVYGAGLEHCPDVLAQLARGRTLYGNDAGTVALLKSPRVFFDLLVDLDIAHPEVSLSAPREPRGWLAKRVGGCGGTHIRPAQPPPEESGFYYQRRVDGRSMSALFLANGHEADLLGFNEQWSSTHAPQGSYWYGGAVSGAHLSPAVRRQVLHAVQALTVVLGLRGMNSLDFIAAGERMLVLEVNPRPSATCDLYERQLARTVFELHVRACRGERAVYRRRWGRLHGHAILYARDPLRVAEGIDWPAWCSDRPLAHTHIERGAPVCTVHACGRSVPALRRLLDDRAERMWATVGATAGAGRRVLGVV